MLPKPRTEPFTDEEKDDLGHELIVLFFGRLLERDRITGEVRYVEALPTLERIHKERVDHLEPLSEAVSEVKKACKKFDRLLSDCTTAAKEVLSNERERLKLAAKRGESDAPYHTACPYTEIAMENAERHFRDRTPYTFDLWEKWNARLDIGATSNRTSGAKRLRDPISLDFLQDFTRYAFGGEPSERFGEYEPIREIIRQMWMKIKADWDGWHRPSWFPFIDQGEIPEIEKLRSSAQSGKPQKHDPAFEALIQPMLMLDHGPAKITKLLERGKDNFHATNPDQDMGAIYERYSDDIGALVDKWAKPKGKKQKFEFVY